jgi:DNA-binding IclR family transcriptional regulator
MSIDLVHPVDTSSSVLRKTQLILEAFGPDDASLSLSELARRTGVAKASVYRLAQELLGWGVLERSGSSYRLGMRLFEIGQRVPRQRIVRDAARPYMEDLHQTTGEIVHLAILDGLEIMYLEKIYGHGQVIRQSRIAGRMPLHCTATGKAFLAFGPNRLFDEVLGLPLDRVTTRTLTSPRMLAEDVARMKAQGYALEREETRIGYLSVAMPLFGATGAMVAALSITAPTSRSDVNRYVGLLSTVTGRITKSIMLPAV